MLFSEVIIVGGGPAGSTCAWELLRKGIECIILDKKTFPRPKVCAGWITPTVVKNLDINLDDHPFGLIHFDKIYFHIRGKRIKIKTSQYSIRRYEFDHWLLERSGVTVYHHRANNIKREDNHYIIDNQYRCKYLVGAAGTYCPVYKTFFKDANPRTNGLLITAMEDELIYTQKDDNCYLWFFDKNLPGYSWYVPKGGGYLNIGLGGITTKLKNRNIKIKDQWNLFIEKLQKLSLIRNGKFNPKGYHYYFRQNVQIAQIGNTFIIGDSAGLASKDMGEGIGPAVESGLLAANSIINGTKYSIKSITKYSIFNIINSGFKDGKRVIQ